MAPDNFFPEVNVLLDAFELEPGSVSYCKFEHCSGWPFLRYIVKDSEPGVIWISSATNKCYLRPKDLPSDMFFQKLTYSDALCSVFCD
jgi:hypothetical protein